MNRKATFPLPSLDGFVHLKGFDKPLPQEVADAIVQLGNETTRSGAGAKLRSAIKDKVVDGVLSQEVVCKILVENNGLTPTEAKAAASAAFRE